MDDLHEQQVLEERLGTQLDYPMLLRLQVNRINLLMSGATGDFESAIMSLESNLEPYKDAIFEKEKTEEMKKYNRAIERFSNRDLLAKDDYAIVTKHTQTFSIIMFRLLMKLMDRKNLLVASEGSARI
jgi:hypothetical protein